MISIEDRQHAVQLIADAWEDGSTLTAACDVIGISIRTHQRWVQTGEITADRCPLAERPMPANALTAEEESETLKQCHRDEFADLPPDQIVVRLMDEEQRYIASVSSFYRVLRKRGCTASCSGTTMSIVTVPSRFVTPMQRHTGEDKVILAKRHALNLAARAAHPERWSGDTRNWEPGTLVSLNPERKVVTEAVRMAA